MFLSTFQCRLLLVLSVLLVLLVVLVLFVVLVLVCWSYWFSSTGPSGPFCACICWHVLYLFAYVCIHTSQSFPCTRVLVVIMLLLVVIVQHLMYTVYFGAACSVNDSILDRGDRKQAKTLRACACNPCICKCGF